METETTGWAVDQILNAALGCQMSTARWEEFAPAMRTGTSAVWWSKIEGVIAGAGGVIDEVDGAIGYFQDVVASGRKIAMLAAGYGPSGEPGVAEVARWTRTVLPDQSIDWWQVTDPAW